MADEKILDAGASDIQSDVGAQDAPVVGTPQDSEVVPTVESNDVAGSLLSNDTPVADTAPVSAAPEQYELVMPEGMTMSDEHRALYEKQAREAGLSNEQASAVLKMSFDNVQAQREAHITQVRGWEETLKNDAEIGGANFNANVEYAKSGLEKFDDGGKIKELLHNTGYGSHPDVVKFFAKLGRAMSEDKVVTGASKATEEIPRHEKLYGKYNNL